jgi:hypothetical protein
MNNNNENLKKVNPIIFTKKINNKHKIIPLNLTINTSGPVKHFPPSTREWFNSVYAYNSNFIKTLSIADKNLSRLIKSYFNFYFSNKVLKSKRIAMRFRRLLVKKIFVSKAEVKHTSSKVIITIYVYNEEKRFLNNKIKRLTSIVFPSNNILEYKNLWKKSRPLYFIEINNLLWYEYYNTPLLKWISNNALNYLKKFSSEREKFSNVKINKLSKLNILNRKNLLEGLEQWVDLCCFSIKQHVNYTCLDNFYFKFLRSTLLSKEYKTIKYYKTLLKLNKAKFEDFFILRLKPLVQDIYKKKVEFNIVNLKSLYYNSNIFTQAIALKLRNRDNRLIRVLRSALYLVKLPRVNIIRERYHKTVIKQLWDNKVKNLKVDYLLNSLTLNTNKDLLDNVLLNLFYNSSFINNGLENIPKSSISVKDGSLLNFFLSSLKHKNMSGVRLEAKGRLTRRFTASRAVFKIKWKGGIRNIDSSYRGLSTVLLRGHLKSNVQYSVISSKTRNGAFGIKGWVGSK